MKIITFVTSNKGKYIAAKTYLKEFGIKVVQKAIEVPESRGSVEKIAAEKAKYGFKCLKTPVIALDAGFYVHSLKGFPGIFTRFVTETIGIEGLLKLVKGKSRKCEFREVLSYCDSSKRKPRLFVRIIKGRLSDKILGEKRSYHWSDLARIFILKKERKTLAQMEKKDFVSFNRNLANSHWSSFGKFFSQSS